MEPTRRVEGRLVEARLGLWDAVSIIIGIIIGVGIFENPARIFSAVPDAWTGLGIWVLSGALALIGAFCFAELASTYPRSGGEYVYLTRAFGPLAGFLFAWAQLTLIRPGSIGALAYLVGLTAAKMTGLGTWESFLLAVASIVVLTVVNILGVTLGKNTQNLLTVAKVLGLAAIVVVGIFWGRPDNTAAAVIAPKGSWFASAMILALWTYAGWHEAAYIAAEVRNGRRNIPLALIFGTTSVIVIYLAVNLAYLMALGFEGAKGAAVPAQILERAWGGSAGNAINVLIIVSSLGAINGMIFTTARIYSEFGVDHRLFEPLSRWSRRWGTPVQALVAQAAITLALLVGVGALVHLGSGDHTPARAASIVGLSAAPLGPAPVAPVLATGRDAQTRIADGFEELIYVTSAVFWLFFLLTGVALFVLRTADAHLPRPFRVPGYPLLPLLFCLACAGMVGGAIYERAVESLIGLGILLLGLLFYFLPRHLRREPVRRPEPPVPAGAV
jgi:amino acid transporter